MKDSGIALEMDEARETGYAEGHAKGREEGRRQQKIESAMEAARNAISLGLTEQQVATTSGLSVQDIKELMTQMNCKQ